MSKIEFPPALQRYREIGYCPRCGQAFGVDDFNADEIVLPVNHKIRVRITARDVLHNFYLPHFRVKMDAVPGLPTYFVFTPTKTTEEFRDQLRKYPEYQTPSDAADPNSDPLWKAFDYELACAELCGKGHYSMRKKVRIVSEDEYKSWLAQQKSTYLTTIRNTDEDPFKGQLLDIEIKNRHEDFFNQVKKIVSADSLLGKASINLKNLQFESGSDKLLPVSKYELDNMIELLTTNTNMRLEVDGHTDNTGNAATNLDLSTKRANAVKTYLVNKGIAAARLNAIGFGQNKPIDTNDTEDGRKNNRRTEFKILSK